MKLRNQLLALACLLVFGVLGWQYVRIWVVQKPYGIILFVSDAMVARQITIARLYSGGADRQLAMEAFPNLALLRNDASDFAVPDDAAAASALATGQRTNHRFLSTDPGGRALQSITELARSKGYAVGIVTNANLADPTPGAFYAHSSDARDRDRVALQMIEKFRPDVALGGGAIDFLPQPGGRRRDDRNLLEELKQHGSMVVRSKAELENAYPSLSSGIFGLFSGESLAFANQIESGSQQPSLSDMVRRAITFLQQSGKGYVLIVDASLAGTAAQQNAGERTIAETLALDRAIATASQFAGQKTLILAVGKHSTGGLTLNGYPQRQDNGFAILGMSPEGYPSLTWSSGPNGPATGAASSLAPAVPASGANPKGEPAACFSPSALNNAEDVVALGKGLGSDKLRGIMDNTEIYQIIRDALH